MKHLQQALICISVLALVFLGCKKEYSYEVPGGSVSGSYQWSFTEGANAYKGPVDTAFIDTLGTQKQLNISGQQRLYLPPGICRYHPGGHLQDQ